jgi:hypothetical protein
MEGAANVMAATLTPSLPTDRGDRPEEIAMRADDGDATREKSEKHHLPGIP